MERLEHIVVGLDLTPRGDRLTRGSRLALDQAEQTARRVGCRVTLLHSEAADERWDVDSGGYSSQPGSASERKALERALAQLAEAGVQADLVVCGEPAWLAVIRYVLREKVDLVVVGKRSDDVTDAPPIGSVATKLLRKCPCAVWVVKPDPDGRPGPVLAATDLAPVGRRVLEAAARVCAERGARLHVVHALSLPMAIQMEGASAEKEYVEQTRAAVVAEIRALLAGLEGGAGAELHVGLSSPTRAILECVERLSPNLVVMGTVSRGGIPGFLVGNTAERLLGRLDCSILAVKPEGFICPVSIED